MSERMRWSLVMCLILLMLAGSCAREQPPATTPVAPPSLEGRSSAKFLFDALNPALDLPEDVRFDRPSLLGSPRLPDYPPDALAAGDGPHREIVRIIIDPQGNVSEVSDSPLGISDRGPHAASFRGAVESAVRTWQFSPGAIRHVAPGTDLDGDGEIDYKVTTSRDVVPVYYDVRFTFTIVDGRGIVRTE